MAIVVGIKFRTGQKIYYFDPNGETFKEGDNAILETARGQEFGKVVFGNKEVPDSEVVQPLKPVLRKATSKDEEQNEKNLSERARLMEETVKKVFAHNLPMKVVDAEYTFDRTKIIIYFTADMRVDFRELVKDLASLFHLRIELRQIYERDDIKLRGALAVCGRPCCCITHLQDYEKVSIKMAKFQNLSLNPSKISGCCGKLMCCLRYENDYYQETYKLMPKVNSMIDTPDGDGQVVGTDMLKREVKVRITDKEGGVEIKTFPLEKLNVKAVAQEPTDDDEDNE